MEKDELEPVDIETDRSPEPVLKAASPLKLMSNKSNLSTILPPADAQQPFFGISNTANCLNTRFNISEKENLVNNLNNHLLNFNVNSLASNVNLPSFGKTLQLQYTEQPQPKNALLYTDSSLHSVTNPESLLSTQLKVQDLQAQVLKAQTEIKRNNAMLLNINCDQPNMQSASEISAAKTLLSLKMNNTITAQKEPLEPKSSNYTTSSSLGSSLNETLQQTLRNSMANLGNELNLNSSSLLQFRKRSNSSLSDFYSSHSSNLNTSFEINSAPSFVTSYFRVIL